MNTTKRLLSLLMCMCLCVPTIWAQEPQSAASIEKDVTIIIQQQQVRFTAQKAIEEMQLQIFDQHGEIVFDSGILTQPEINWLFQTGAGENVKSGLYAYQLTIREAGKETRQTRRGHFIVDRAKDRDSVTDKLWVTSQNENGVGTDLTVARDENSTLVGMATPRREPGENQHRGNQPDRVAEGGADNEKATRSVTTAAASGAINQVAKFTSATDLGGSVIYEVNGRVGIGTSNPEFGLHVNGDSAIVSSGSAGGFFFRNRETSTPNVFTDYWGWYSTGNLARFHRAGVGDLMTITTNGVMNYGQLAKLDVAANNYAYIRAHDLLLGHPTRRGEPGRALVDAGAYGLCINFAGDWGSTTIGSNVAVVGSDFLIGHPQRRGAPGRALVDGGANGLYINFAKDWSRTVIESNLVVKGALEITNGADFAENFDINAASETSNSTMTKIEPGMVVSIDPASPGKLALSARSYDRRVAGIISGAGGIKPGMVMGQEETIANGKHPVALSGRVYVWVDASYGAVKPGDLLTTSATPGHAMKVRSSARAQGAILGKAMTSLKEGKGLVLVLVTLQ